MNRFGEIADDLTDMLEELERAELAPEARLLKTALERAFVRACEAERSLRLKSAEPVLARAHRRRVDTSRSAEVISLPRRWDAEQPASRAAAGD